MTTLPTWVHIGLPKTGTTTLQQVIFTRHEQILYLGKFVAEDLNDLSRELTVTTENRFDEQRASTYLHDRKSQPSNRHRVCVFSEELLSYSKTMPPELSAGRIKGLFPNARVILVLRNPFEWLQSIYFFNLKRRKPSVLQGFNEWLASELSKPPHESELATLAVDRLSAGYAELFGVDAIKVMRYEDFRSNPENFLKHLSTLLGIDPVETIQLYSSSSRRRLNLRLTIGQEEFCRKFALVTRGQHREYVGEIMPFIERLPPNQRDRARQMLPEANCSDATASRKLRALSRFIDGAAYPIISHGETATATFDPKLYDEIRARVEGGYRKTGSALGIDVSAYFGGSPGSESLSDAPADQTAPLRQPVAVSPQQPGIVAVRSEPERRQVSAPRHDQGYQVPSNLFDLMWEKLHLSAGATGRNCNSHFVELFLSVCCELAITACFEVGAFEASFSKEIKRRRPELAVYAFEANAEVFRRFRQTIPEGITYLNEAIGSEEGMCMFHIPVAVGGTDGEIVRPRRGNIRTSSLHPQNSDDVEYESVSSKCSTLDAWQAKLGGPPSAVWIDVEGAAKEVLSGGRNALGNSIQCVAIELEKRSFWVDQWLAADVTGFMAELDFVPLARDMETGWQYNQIFIRRSVISKSVLNHVGKYIDVLLRQIQ